MLEWSLGERLHNSASVAVETLGGEGARRAAAKYEMPRSFGAGRIHQAPQDLHYAPSHSRSGTLLQQVSQGVAHAEQPGAVMVRICHELRSQMLLLMEAVEVRTRALARRHASTPGALEPWSTPAPPPPSVSSQLGGALSLLPVAQRLRAQVSLLSDLTDVRTQRLMLQHTAQSEHAYQGALQHAPAPHGGGAPIPTVNQHNPPRTHGDGDLGPPPGVWMAQAYSGSGWHAAAWPHAPPPQQRHGAGRDTVEEQHSRGECSPCFFHFHSVCPYGSQCYYCHEPHDRLAWGRPRAPRHMRIALRALRARLAQRS